MPYVYDNIVYKNKKPIVSEKRKQWVRNIILKIVTNLSFSKKK